MKFKVAGVQHHKADFIDILDESYEYELTKSELMDIYCEGEYIFKYEIYDGLAELVPEPDNKYDKNAIAVIVEGVKIGYVPKDMCSKVLPLIDDRHDFHVSILGGPYKELIEDDEGKIRISRGSLNFTSTLVILEKTDSDTPVSTCVPQEEPDQDVVSASDSNMTGNTDVISKTTDVNPSVNEAPVVEKAVPAPEPDLETKLSSLPESSSRKEEAHRGSTGRKVLKVICCAAAAFITLGGLLLTLVSLSTGAPFIIFGVILFIYFKKK